LLPGQIDLILQLTSALRARSSRAQGDDQAIRGLLQLLGELFRDQRLADKPLGALVTLDQIYEVQHTALDSDVQDSMARLLNQCAKDSDQLMVRAAKAVALLELIQDTTPTDAKLVAQCLYDRVDLGNNLATVTDALEALRQRNLLGFSEKQGYKIQSSAAEEWERERREIGVSREAIAETVQEALKTHLSNPERPRLEGRPFPWSSLFSDGRRLADVPLAQSRDDASVTIDLRFLPREDRTDSTWIKRSDELAVRDRLLWLCGDTEQVEHLARELGRSLGMMQKYKPRKESLTPARKLLLQQEDNRASDLDKLVKEAVGAAWMAGRLYFRGQSLSATELGSTFGATLLAAGTKILPDLFPHFVATQVAPSEVLQLIEAELSGISPKFLSGDPSALGLLELDRGRYVPTCSGVVPRRILAHIERESAAGDALLQLFGGPPFGYTASVVKSAIAGLLRAGKIKISPESGQDITAVRDAGVKDLFEKDRAFRRANIHPAGEDDIGVQVRARICKFFEERLRQPVDREDHAIADAVAAHFPDLARRLRDVLSRLDQLPTSPPDPTVFLKLNDALEETLRTCRQTRPTVRLVKKHLDTLRDGVSTLQLYDAELTPDAIAAVKNAHTTLHYRWAQLEALGIDATTVAEAAERVRTQLASPRPWRDIGAIEPDLLALNECYTFERSRLLTWQEREAEATRLRVKVRDGFSTLTGEQSHKVLRPISLAVTTSSAEAIAPPLSALKDPFLVGLKKAEDQANEILDELLSEGTRIITKVDLRLRNREVSTEAEVLALIDEIRERLLAQVKAGTRVRLL